MPWGSCKRAAPLELGGRIGPGHRIGRSHTRRGVRLQVLPGRPNGHRASVQLLERQTTWPPEPRMGDRSSCQRGVKRW